MKRRILYNPTLPSTAAPVLLGAEEAHHARNVLRLANHSQVELIDGRGGAVVGELRLEKRKSWVHWVADPTLSDGQPHRELVLPLTVLLAVTKTDAFSFALEKLAELGCDQVQPFFAEQSTVAAGKQDADKLLHRWERITIDALKQCGRRQAPKIGAPTKGLAPAIALAAACQAPLFAAADEELSKTTAASTLPNLLRSRRWKRVVVAVGPEAGWSHNERTLLSAPEWHRFTLGPNVLRAETAATAIATLVAAFCLDSSA